ncbi:hypothetical protein LCGC14_1618130 [marine sediment metagenome]|uniref:Uncharacterized protein n=1 Tax=marine sediment metagenome TaxID=412755 RepID=A0A0F9I6A4_9ZZZZ
MKLMSLLQNIGSVLTDLVKRKFTGQLTIEINFSQGGIGKTNVIQKTDLDDIVAGVNGD